ncbi:hypothetical protein ON010_g3542 [Phytophthora cinnamomi]|nr:hypothetical protein ON010_g3542 [Phytophthora cinnamomi]
MTCNTARRVLRSDKAPVRRLSELENGDESTAARNPAPDQQLDAAIAGMRQEMTTLQDSLRLEVTASMTNVSDRITAEMHEIQGQLANEVQAMTNMVTTLNQTQAMAQAPQQLAVEAHYHVVQQAQATTVAEPLRGVSNTGAYPGYVSKFRNSQRVVRFDELRAVNLFVNGLTNGDMKKVIQRKQPASLTAAAQEGFLELLGETPGKETSPVSEEAGATSADLRAAGDSCFRPPQAEHSGGHGDELLNQVNVVASAFRKLKLHDDKKTENPEKVLHRDEENSKTRKTKLNDRKPWLKTNNPDIDWVNKRVKPGDEAQQLVDIESYRDHPAYLVLLKHKLPHGAPTFRVKKPVGWRIVHDYRSLNTHTIRRTLPMPRKDKIINKMQGSYWFSCLDFLSGYYQFRVRESDAHFTAFQAPDGAYEYLMLPMGLSNAPATFNAGVRRKLSDLSEICESYFDDIYVYTKSPSMEKHLDALDRRYLAWVTMSAEMEYELTLRKKKYCEIGHYPVPEANCSRSWARPFGGVLFQEEGEEDGRKERSVAFGGLKYKAAEKNYSIRENFLRLYLVSTCGVFTYSINPRWYDELSEYPIKFRYIPAKDNTVADGISRRPDFMDEQSVTPAAITRRKQVKQRVNNDLGSLVKEAVVRYNEDPLTASLHKYLSRIGECAKPNVT